MLVYQMVHGLVNLSTTHSVDRVDSGSSHVGSLRFVPLQNTLLHKFLAKVENLTIYGPCNLGLREEVVLINIPICLPVLLP